MSTDITVPSVGESVQEGVIHKWLKNDGDAVVTDEVLVELETDKATVEVVAENEGVLKIIKQAGERVTIGEVIATLEHAAKSKTMTKQEAEPKTKTRDKKSALSPAVQRMVSEHNIDVSNVQGTGKDGRPLKKDLSVLQGQTGEKALETAKDSRPLKKESGMLQGRTNEEALETEKDSRPLKKESLVLQGQTSEKAREPEKNSRPLKTATGERREPMSMIRKRTAERLVSSKNQTAMLTTFNEINLEQIIACRKKYKEVFSKKYEVSLGFMGFFCLACAEALQEFPELNAFVAEDDIIYHDYVNMGIAVSTPRGLVVPVLKNVETLTLPQIEQQIVHFARKARDNKITIEDMSHGTFTISNGGVFGSLLSTPILNPPQSGILGMHKIERRAIVVNEQIAIASMMYVALSYDHRIADGKQAVGFLVRVKELLEDPTRLVLRI